MFDITMEGISIGPLEFRFYSLLILAGIAVGVVIAQREARRYGEDPSHVINITVVGALSAIVGARLYHVIDQWGEYYSANPGDIVKVWNGGIGIFGAVVGAIIGLVAYVWWVNRQAEKRDGRRARKLHPLRWLDIGAPAFLVGQAVGRWGNFFNQELYGPPTDLPWGIPIDVDHRPIQYINETHFHPLFLYESILSFIGVFVLLYLARRFSRRLLLGDVMLMYFMWYGAERFFLEFLRIDNWTVGGIAMAQIVGALLVIGAAVAMFLRHKYFRGQPAIRAAEEDEEHPHHSRTAERRRRRRTGLDS
jgi:phosphatidylglycerol:prolipoprotein diacylglycerol transferase